VEIVLKFKLLRVFYTASNKPSTAPKVGAVFTTKKEMIMRQKKPLEKKKALQLINQGHSQKDIAIKLNVSEKTVGKWAAEWRYIDNQKNESIKNLTIRLNELSLNKDSKISDIKDLVLCIKELENGVFVNKKRSSQK
jgi:predicted transcriptional regulator